jgi:hypothetical protein
VDETLVAPSLIQSGYGGLRGGGGNDGDLGIVGDQSDDVPPRCGIGKCAEALGAHEVVPCRR